MFVQRELLVVFFILNHIRTIVLGNLTISGTQCGQKKCQIGEFCSEFDGVCQSCDLICTQTHHNFDENECVKSCQDYLHDIRYVRKNGSGVPSEESLEKFKVEVQKLSRMVVTTLALVCFMLLVLAIVLGFQLYRWKIKKNITLQYLKSMMFKKTETSNNDNRVEEGHQNNGNFKPDLRLDISNISTISDHSPVTAMTSVSTRRPAEDSALDYAYDNHAMSASPK